MGFALSDMKIRSSAFSPHGRIPARHTGQGEDVSPPLEWTDAPEDARSFAVICHDPDAPLCKAGSYGFVHWVLYNIPASVTSLAENGGAAYTRGRTDFDGTSYGGPIPPASHGPHHYYFWLLALDRETDLESGLSMKELLHRVEPHVIAMNRLVGTYERD